MRNSAEWWAWRVQRWRRKLAFARPRAVWVCRDVLNGWRIFWELTLLARPIADITRYERRVDAQNGEDGILEAIFAKIGTTNKRYVEFGTGDAHECNTRYLRRWKGWNGLWMDAVFADRRGVVKREAVSAENIQALFAKYGVPKQLDLLSIDIDGNDYWIWQAITDYAPRVVVIEYNSTILPSESLTIPYDPNYRWNERTNYYGASLRALQRLGTRKGYTLVGCDNSGTNAFFVQQALVPGRFLPQPLERLYRLPTVFGGQGHPRDPRPMVSV
jgi:hypothetical protein